MSIHTADCVLAIVDFFKSQNVIANSDLLNPKKWKRVSKSGSAYAIRIFRNGDTKVQVESNDINILSIALVPNTVSVNSEFKDFPYSKVLSHATIYSKGEIRDWEVSSLEEDIEDNDDLEPHTITKDSRIGILNSKEDNIQTIIVITKDTKYYSYDESMTSDGVVYFEVSTGMSYAPAQEPVDLLETGFENGGGTKLQHHKSLEQKAKDFKLGNFLVGM